MNSDATNGKCVDDNEQTKHGLQNGAGNRSDKKEESDETEEKSQGGKDGTKSSIFHIDTSRIIAVPTSEQVSELQELGVSVFNQDEFEQGVLEQVDRAIFQEEAKLAKKRDEKELKTVLEDIRTCRAELQRLQRVAAGMRFPSASAAVNKDLERKLMSVRTQKDNKAKQLKKLRAKHRSLSTKLNGSVEEAGLDDVSEAGEGVSGSSAAAYERLLSDEEAPGPSRSETEQERLIRLGEMTPFGTSLTVAEQQKPKPKQPSFMVTDFEKFLGEKDIATYKKHKVVSKWKGTSNKVKGTAAGNSSQDDGSILRGLLTPKAEPTKRKVDSRSRKDKGRKADSTSKEKKLERKRMEFEPKKYSKGKDKWNCQGSKGKRKSAMMKDLTENWDSDDEQPFEDDDEYVPGNDSEEDAAFDDAAYSDEEPAVGRRYARQKQKKLSDQIADGTITSLNELKRKHGVRVERSQDARHRRARDDATQDQYLRRLREDRKKKLRMKQAKIERRSRGEEDGEDCSDDSSDSQAWGDEEEVEMDGGFKIPSTIWKKLYRYQKIGVKWLWELHRQKAGGILGDEMGLGKTIQIIAFLAGLRSSALPSRGFSYRGLGPVLIVCPATVLHQWVKEFHTWYPEMRVAILHESGAHSGKKEALVHDVVSCHGVLITSFSNVRLRQELLLHFNWHYVILDEGHKIRNPDASVTLACKQFRTPHRLILTGSPMQNNLRELWSLIDFVFPGKLGTLPVFMQQFSVPIVQGGYANASKVQVQTAYKCACILRDSINPYLLRRMKADVQQVLQLPSKNEQVLFCHLTEEQTQVYEDYLASKECNLILRGDYKVFAGLIVMRKICNHPDLVSGGPKIFSHENLKDEDLRPEQHYGYYKRSGKMIVVESLLKLWKQQNHRVLLFSQSKQMLDIMEDFVQDRYSYMRMDGTTPISSRQPLINKYNSDSSIFLFLLTTRVGGLGVNLIGANRVIIYDPDWNPSTDTQARERSWRIGQNKQVTIYRLLTAGTIEEKIYHRQIFKTFLSNRVLKDPRQRRFFKSNDLFELFTLGTSEKSRSTETSAIFAGTGSDVRPSASASTSNSGSKVKREPMVKLGRKKDAAAEKEERRKKRVEVVEREKRMKRKMEAEKKVKQEEEEKEMEDGSNSAINHPDDAGAGCSYHGNASLSGNGGISLEIKVEPGLSPSPAKKMKSSSSSSSSSTTQVHSISSTSKTPPKSSHLSSRDRKEKRKKRRDAKLDGQKIPHLAKTKAFVPKAEQEDEVAKNADQDNYVLAKLFKKSGVHSALQHDNIMQSSNPDYVLVENEAERVAKEAANAVRLSRRRCYNASSGIPTWTGTAGGNSGPKLKFGKKSNTRLVENTEKKESPKMERFKKKKLFGGKKPMFGGDTSTATVMDEDAEKPNDMPSSKSLLNSMRARNHLQANSGDDSSGEDESGNSAAPTGTEHDGLMTGIVEFISNNSQIPGQASTGELLKAFAGKIDTSNTAVFRSMLRQVCNFQRQHKDGVWRLKVEYL